MSSKLIPAACLRLASLVLVTIVGQLATALPASAAVLSLSATDFVVRCNSICPGSGPEPDDSVIDNGVLKPPRQAFYYARVPFPTDGAQVCSFSLIYQDVNNEEGARARLLKKQFAVGKATFGAPKVMASVSTAGGAVQTVRKATTSTITQPKIAMNTSFYFVEIDVDNINVNLLGVQIDHRQSCP